MSAGGDPGFWGTVGPWLWGVLAVPMKFVWDKANGAVSKSDFKEYLELQREEHKHFQTQIVKLFENAEADRRELGKTVHRLNGKIHRLALGLAAKGIIAPQGHNEEDEL